MKLYRSIFILIFFLFNCNALNAQVYPNTFTLDNEVLKKNKEVLKDGDNSNIKKAYEILIAEANLALKRGPYSVTKKEGKFIPPGASPNDFYSLSTYWWPNPKKSSGLPYVNRDGKVNHERDSIPDRNELINVANDVYILGLAFYFSENESYAKKAKELIEVFFLNEKTKMNPNFEFSQSVPGHKVTGGATITAYHFVNLLNGVRLMENYTELDKDVQSLKVWFSSFLDWMLNSEKGQRQKKANNNVGTYYTVQAVSYALFVDNLDLAKSIFRSQAYRRVDEQINSEGKMPHELKRATPYSYVATNTTGFIQLSILGEKLEEDLWNYKGKNGGSVNMAYNNLFELYLDDNLIENKERVNTKNTMQVIAKYSNFGDKYSKAKVENRVNISNSLNVDKKNYQIWLTSVNP